MNTRNLEFDLCDVGASMDGYYGGKSEARIRHQIIECMLADFRSQYPSANALKVAGIAACRLCECGPKLQQRPRIFRDS
jgi:hypothetical protein